MGIIGDVHLGHPNTPTTHILNGLRQTFPNSPLTSAINWLIIEGDLFDRELSLRDPNVREIETWAIELLHTCKKWNICLRILEGTPAHDWRQSRIFTHHNLINNIGADVKYFTDLEIEYIERFDIHVLYIPDEWRVRCDDTWVEVLSLLRKCGLKQVDYIVMHGAFHHQMPTNLHDRLELHTAERYMSICRRHILVGHVHQWSKFDRVIGSGSWDRLTHGDESPKGYTRISVKENVEDDVVRFVENPYAMRYDTVDCCDADSDAMRKIVHFKVKDLPDNSRVRLKGYKSDVVAASLEFFRERYPKLHFDLAIVAPEDEQTKPVMVDMRQKHVSVRITRENIQSLLFERIQKKHPNVNLERMSTIFQEVVNVG